MPNKKDLRELMRETLNENLLRDLKLSDESVERLTDLQVEKHELLQKARKLSVKEEYSEIRLLAKDLTQLEFQIQEVYGFKHELSWHKPWQIPGCDCPVYENILRWPSEVYLISSRCPIHGPKKK